MPYNTIDTNKAIYIPNKISNKNQKFQCTRCFRLDFASLNVFHEHIFECATEEVLTKACVKEPLKCIKEVKKKPISLITKSKQLQRTRRKLVC